MSAFPPNYQNYPRGPQGYGLGPGQPLGFNLITVAFNFLGKNNGFCIGLSFVNLILIAIASIPVYFAELPIIQGMQRGVVVPGNPGLILFAALWSLAIQPIIFSGSAIHIRRVMLGDRPSPIGMFTSPRNWGAFMGAGIILNLAAVLGSYCLIVPGIYMIGRLSMAPILASEFNLSFGDALTQSWNRSASNAWLIGGISILAYIVSILGAMICGIGIILTQSIFPLTVALISLAVIPPENSGPPPTDYRTPPGSPGHPPSSPGQGPGGQGQIILPDQP